MIREIGPDRLMFSTDYPHPECDDDPVQEFAQRMEGVPADIQAQVFAGNSKAFIGV
jgi:hypothetical protein